MKKSNVSFQEAIKSLSDSHCEADEICEELRITSSDAQVLNDLLSSSYKELIHLRDRFKHHEVKF